MQRGLTLGIDLEVHNDSVAENLNEARDVAIEREVLQLLLFRTTELALQVDAVLMHDNGVVITFQQLKQNL